MGWGVAVGLMIVLGWIVLLNEWGTVAEVSSSGLMFKPFLGRVVFVPWTAIKGPVKFVSSPIPRLVLRLKSTSFLSLHAVRVVVLRYKPWEHNLLARLEETVGIRRLDTSGTA
jgi:hypothetical protein